MKLKNQHLPFFESDNKQSMPVLQAVKAIEPVTEKLPRLPNTLFGNRAGVIQLAQVREVYGNYRAKVNASYPGVSLRHRLRMTRTWLRYTYLSLYVEGVQYQQDFFTDLLNCMHCKHNVEDIALCIQAFAGQGEEFRDKLLQTLKRHIIRRLQEVGQQQDFGCLACKGGATRG